MPTGYVRGAIESILLDYVVDAFDPIPHTPS